MSGNAQADQIRALLEAGKLGWLEIVVDPWEGYGPGTAEFIAEWEAEFPNEFVTAAGDDSADDKIFAYTSPSLGGGMPQGGLIDADFNWETTGIYEAMPAALTKYGN